MEFPSTGSGLLSADVLLKSPPAASAPQYADDQTFAAFAITTHLDGHVGDYTGLPSHTDASQTMDAATKQTTLQPGQAGLRWSPTRRWPMQFTMHAVQALGFDNQSTIPGLTVNRDASILAQPWAKYAYGDGNPVQQPNNLLVSPPAGGLLYRISFAPDANGISMSGYLRAGPKTGAGAARDLHWFVPAGVLTPGANMIDLRPTAEFTAIAGPAQVGGLMLHADAALP